MPTALTYSISVPAEVVHATTSALPDHLGDPIQWFYDLVCENQWSLKEAAQKLNRHESNLPRLWRGTYQGSINAFVATINQFREHHSALAGKTNNEFVMTPEAKEIFYACEKVIASREIGLLYGSLGAGKTMALEEFTNRRGAKALLVRTPSSCSYGTFLREFGRTLGIPSKGLDLLREQILSRLRRRGLDILIIDEFHEPFLTSRGNTCVRICEFTREIFDKLKTPILICGTEVLPNHLRKGQWKAALEQLVDRGNTEVNISRRTSCKGLEDIFAFYSLPIPTGEAKKLVEDILIQHSIRKLVFKLRDAVRAATNRKEPITWDHFIDAHALNELMARNDK